MSCGQIALVEEGFTIKEYYASEIEKNAIKVTQENFPDTKQIGDVMNFILEIKNDKDIILNEEKLKELPKVVFSYFWIPMQIYVKGNGRKKRI